MKILSVPQIREADQYTIENEPISSIDLMERAAKELFIWIAGHFEPNVNFCVICGPGNNGGDGMALSRMMQKHGFKVRTFYLTSEKFSPDFLINKEKLEIIEHVDLKEITDVNSIPVFQKDEVIIDAIFGSGLTKPVKGFIAEVIKKINGSGNLVVAIDIPSGLFAGESSVGLGGEMVNATFTLSFQFPKLAFMFPENYQFVGDWHILPIGLHQDFISTAETSLFYCDDAEVRPMLKSKSKFAHKGNFGHVLLIAGSYGKMGAAVLASRAAHRIGSGLVTTHIPSHGIQILQVASPETMLSVDESEKIFSKVPVMSNFNAIGIGPGIGTNPKTAEALKFLIQETPGGLLFDADAINILSENKTWLGFLPQGCIFTPHIGEFKRLVGSYSNDFDRMKLQKDFSFKNQCYVVLKGAHTCITTPSGNCFFNSTGNPGMATGGSGDVLTGIILGLLAQGYSAVESCILGTFIHGRAGDLALDNQSYESLIASDIIDHIGKAFTF